MWRSALTLGGSSPLIPQSLRQGRSHNARSVEQGDDAIEVGSSSPQIEAVNLLPGDVPGRKQPPHLNPVAVRVDALFHPSEETEQRDSDPDEGCYRARPDSGPYKSPRERHEEAEPAQSSRSEAGFLVTEHSWKARG